MRASQYYLATINQVPSDAVLVSHQLMLRSGMIKRLSSGIYSYLPLGLKVIKKVEAIVREEMNAINAVEILMSAMQPAELWNESGRFLQYGKELIRLKDRNDRDFCLGPTHEEVVVDLLRDQIKSYKQLPLCVYQIQTKYRDEIRPRFGLMRSREFTMKDAYSFHTDNESLSSTYWQMYAAYDKIFKRLGLNFRAVEADTGSIGGRYSHEFQVLTDSGEDIIAYSDGSNYAANIEMATSVNAKTITLVSNGSDNDLMQMVVTKSLTSCEDVAKLLNIPLAYTVKSLVFSDINDKPVLVLLRGDHSLNEVKLTKVLANLDDTLTLKSPLSFFNNGLLSQYFGADAGFLGPVGFVGHIIADEAVICMSHMVCGANTNDQHMINVVLGRDCKMPDVVADIRNVVDGDVSPDGCGTLHLCRGIEVGHVFQLGTKYSEAMNFKYIDNSGRPSTVVMGCYGIGISRVIAACVEQHHDDKGIIFPRNIAPFVMIITPINYHKDSNVKAVADKLYELCLDYKIDVLLDDRTQSPGVMFQDSELFGIPYRATISNKNIKDGANLIEIYERSTGIVQMVTFDQVIDIVNA